MLFSYYRFLTSSSMYNLFLLTLLLLLIHFVFIHCCLFYVTLLHFFVVVGCYFFSHYFLPSHTLTHRTSLTASSFEHYHPSEYFTFSFTHWIIEDEYKFVRSVLDVIFVAFFSLYNFFFSRYFRAGFYCFSILLSSFQMCVWLFGFVFCIDFPLHVRSMSRKCSSPRMTEEV